MAWALYDWANSPFTTLIITFVFPAYFGRAVAGNEVEGQVLWGYGISLSGLVIALLGPPLGAVADAGGRRKPWLLVFTLLCMSASTLLWFVEPRAAFVGPALLWVALANIGFEFGVVFNNAMLPDLVPQERIGRWSGWAWALGYAGGLAALVIALTGFVQAETPWLGLGREQAEHVRILGPLVAIWFAVFAWPLFVLTPDRARPGLSAVGAVRQGLATLKATIAGLPARPNVARFLLAHMLYADALGAVFAFGGIYAAGTFGMTLGEVISFGILLNVTAGVGAFGFAWIDDWIGSRRTVLLALAGLMASASVAVIAEKQSVFWAAGSALGLFVGPAQAASRSLMARLAPKGQETEFFGLLALSGKATAFFGPAVVASVTAASGSQRLGIATLLVFFAIGFALLLGVREPEPVGAAGARGRHG
jgi:UMF1 family MFS transporter